MTIKEIIKHMGKKAEDFQIMIAPGGDLDDLKGAELYLDVMNDRIILSDTDNAQFEEYNGKTKRIMKSL